MKSIAWLYSDWQINDYRTKNDLYGGIGYYRVVKPAQYLKKWFDIEVIGADFRHWGTDDETYTRLGRDYDLIISTHPLTGRDGSNLLATASHYKKKVLADMDDNLFAIRRDTKAAESYAKGKEGRYFIAAFLELASGLTVSTLPLSKVYSKFNKAVDILPNCNDVKDWPKPTVKDDGLIRIGFAGGTEHSKDLEMIAEPVAKILEKYPSTVFEVIGALGPEVARTIAGKMLKVASHKVLDRFRITGGTPAFKGYPELLASQGWNIGICPLITDTFNEGKSHIKWMEYSMVGAATIASPVGPFKGKIQGLDTVVHGKTGLHASGPDEWFECLETLVRNPDIRIDLATNAYDYIKNNWQWEQHIEKWKKVIDKDL